MSAAKVRVEKDLAKEKAYAKELLDEVDEMGGINMDYIEVQDKMPGLLADQRKLTALEKEKNQLIADHKKQLSEAEQLHAAKLAEVEQLLAALLLAALLLAALLLAAPMLAALRHSSQV